MLVTETQSGASRLPVLIRACRPQQWPKNLLVLAAPLAAGFERTAGQAQDVMIALVAFMLVSCSVYLWNDLADAESDRAHPVKRARPIAAGDLSAARAVATATILGTAGLLLPLGTGDGDVVAILAIYTATSLTYSVRLKHEAVLELGLVASGFVLRALAGAAAADVPVSRWFAIVVCAAAVHVVATKRYAELRDQPPSQQRRVLHDYTADLLAEIRFASASVALVGYVLWAFDQADGAAVSGGGLFELSCVPVALAMFRFTAAVHAGAGEAPEEVILRDRQMLAYGVVWAATFIFAVNGGFLG